jgi:NADPH-dependent 2,4-dienoyl-CoA reductase/sulfur reductase-like enzyme
MRQVVIVGSGVCGIEAALALRLREPQTPITIVSDEHDHFFSRPALMYVFAGQMTMRDIEPYDRELFDRMGFERIRGRVASVDPAARRLAMDSGANVAYDRLLLAVGSKARPAPWPGADGPGVHGFVTLRDLEGLDAAARPGGRAVVIGGGLIGVEVAEVLKHRGLHVTFVIRETWYFPVALDAREAALVAEHLRAHGIDVRLETPVEAVLRGPDSAVRGVRVSGEDVPCDLVVVAIGVVPNTAFLAGGPVSCAPSGAIEVDEGLRTGVPGVWAAGDCANVTWMDGSRRPEQLWYTARDQGRAAAASMTGDAAVYRRGAWYNSAKFFDLEYTTAGWVPVTLDFENRPIALEAGVTTWFQRVAGAFASQRVVCRGDRVVGFNMLGGRWNHEPLLEWIQDRRPLDWVLAHLHEAQFDEEFERRFRVDAAAQVS